MTLLQPSVQLGRVRKTQKQVLKDAQLQSVLKDLHKPSRTGEGGVTAPLPGDVSGLIGTTWGRKHRKRRQLKVEKLLQDPRQRHKDEGSLVSSDAESESEGDEDGREGNSIGEWCNRLLITRPFLPKCPDNRGDQGYERE